MVAVRESRDGGYEGWNSKRVLDITLIGVCYTEMQDQMLTER